MLWRRVLVCLAIACVGCNQASDSKAAVGPKAAGSVAVADLPDLGPFAAHVFAEPTVQPPAAEGRQLYRVDMDYQDTVNQLTPVLIAAGWERKSPVLKLQKRFSPFEHPTKGRYSISDDVFEGGPGTCTLGYSQAK